MFLVPCCTEYRVTTHLENLEKSGNSKVTREKSGKMDKVREKSGEVKSGVFFSSCKSRFSAGALPRNPLGELMMLGRGHPIPFPSCYNPNC